MFEKLANDLAPVDSVPALNAADYWQYLRILDRHQRLVPFAPNRIQAHFLANRTGRDIILKPRQVGISTGIVADQSTRAWSETIMGAVMTHEDITTQKLRRMAARFYNNLPADVRPARGLDNATTTTYPATGSEITIITAGNPNAGIGSTLNYFHGSEVSRWRNAGDIISGVLQGLTLNGLAVLESTANGATGAFYDLCMEALSGEGIWKLWFYPWWWEAEYRIALLPGEVLTLTTDERRLVQRYSLKPSQIKWRRFKQAELKEKFQQEYPEDVTTCFLTSGASVFGEINHALYRPKKNQPLPGHIYVAAIDWGQSDDYSVLCIIDVTANREVVLKRWRQMRWQDIRQQMIALMKHWHVSLVLPEKNSASTNIEDLSDEIYEAGLDITVSAQDMTQRFKAMLVGTLRRGLDEDGLKLLDIDFASAELRAFAGTQTERGYSYSAPNGGHDDTVIARLLAYFAAINRLA